LPEHPWGDIARYGQLAARGYLSLVRGDTTDAIRRFTTLPDSLCPICFYERLDLAALYSARHQDREADALVERHLADAFGNPTTVLWRLLRARTEERLGRAADAVRDYGYVAAVWLHADPVLQPYVGEATAGLRRLSREAPHP